MNGQGYVYIGIYIQGSICISGHRGMDIPIHVRTSKHTEHEVRGEGDGTWDRSTKWADPTAPTRATRTG